MPEALWLSLSPRLKRFDWRLLSALSAHRAIAYWEYHQSLDEPCCWESAIALLDNYLQARSEPVPLLGHGIGGVLALRYAERYPQRVRSLVLLSLGSQPRVTWHWHYSALRHCLPCQRSMILGQMVRFLFGPQSYAMTQALVKVLAAELDSGFSCTPGLVADASDELKTPISVPIWLGLGQQDLLLSPLPQKSQVPWLKSQDELWTCPDGRHYFHYEYPQQVAQQITQFWQGAATAKSHHAQHLSAQKVA